MGKLFGKRLKKAREAAGLSQEDLARRTATSVGAISKYERGKLGNPQSDRLLAMANVLGVSVDALIGNKQPTSERAA